MRVLEPLYQLKNEQKSGAAPSDSAPRKETPPALADVLVTALVLSAGTEGLNSILKFLKYAKEDKKAVAASKDPSNPGGGGAAAAAVVPMVPARPSAAALANMNRK